MSKTQVLIERLSLDEAILNPEERTVRQVLIRAGRSANGRVYRPEVLQQAAPLFEGVRTYANHPALSERRERPERSTRDVTGWIVGVEFRDDALYGTRHFARTQAGQDTWALVEDIVSGRAPANLIGASINAVGRASRDNTGDWLVESIDAVHSVDDVTTPAAGGGFLPLGESAGEDLAALVLQLIDFSEWYEIGKARGFSARLQNEMKIIRQTEALKAASADAEQARLELQEAQAMVNGLTDQVAMLSRQLDGARRDLLLEKAMRRVNLPTAWETSLREQLMAVPAEDWEAILKREINKAALLPRPRPAVVGSGVRIAEALSVEPAAIDRTPRDDEDVLSWLRRTRQE